MANRLFIPSHSPSVEMLHDAVKLAVINERPEPLESITTPEIVATLPAVEVIGNREYAVKSTSSVDLNTLPSVPGLPVLITKASLDMTNPKSVLSMTLQAAALLRPSHTYVLIPIAARESSFKPSNINLSQNSSASGLLQLVARTALGTWQAYLSSPSLQSKLKPIASALPPAPVFDELDDWRYNVVHHPYSQIIPSVIHFDQMIAAIVGKGVVTRSGDQNVFHVPAHLIDPVLKKYPFLKTDLKAATQLMCSLWWIHGSGGFKKAWPHLDQAILDIRTLLTFNKKNQF